MVNVIRKSFTVPLLAFLCQHARVYNLKPQTSSEGSVLSCDISVIIITL